MGRGPIPRPFGYSQDRYYSANDTRYAEYIYASANDWIVNPLATYTPGQDVTKTYYKAPMRAGTSNRVPRSPISWTDVIAVFGRRLQRRGQHGDC